MISWKRKREENKGDIDEDALEAIRKNEAFLKKKRKKKGNEIVAPRHFEDRGTSHFFELCTFIIPP